MFLGHFCRKLARDARGSIAIGFGLAVPVILGLTGLAVDSASFYRQQSKMQSVADSASLATAKELFVYRKKLSELQAVGRTRAEALLADAGLAGQDHSTSVTIDGPQNQVRVAITMQAMAYLPVRLQGWDSIAVTSQAMAYGQSKLCVLGLDGASTDTIRADTGASIDAAQCAIQSNSTNAQGLNVATGSRLVSTVICSAGGTTGGGSYNPGPQTDCPALDDPLSSRQPPPVGTCTYTNKVIESGNVSISPGVYCGGLKIGKTAQVTAEPGIYVFSLGPLRVSDTATLTGDNVGFYFQDDLATFEFKSNTTIDLSAPKDGDMAGLLFYENRSAPLGRSFIISSLHARRLLGTIYLPRGSLIINAKSSVADLSAYTVIVAKQVKVSAANLVVNSDYGGTDVPVPEGLGPHSRMVRVAQ